MALSFELRLYLQSPIAICVSQVKHRYRCNDFAYNYVLGQYCYWLRLQSLPVPLDDLLITDDC